MYGFLLGNRNGRLRMNLGRNQTAGDTLKMVGIEGDCLVVFIALLLSTMRTWALIIWLTDFFFKFNYSSLSDENWALNRASTACWT